MNQLKMKQELKQELQYESLYNKVLTLVKAKTSIALLKKTQPKLKNTW